LLWGIDILELTTPYMGNADEACHLVPYDSKVGIARRAINTKQKAVDATIPWSVDLKVALYDSFLKRICNADKA
jgi:hypothetical protein